MNFKVLDISMSKSENLGFTISGDIESYLRVENIKPNGVAFGAGLKNGDCILMINDVQIQNHEDIIKSMKKMGETVMFRVIRKNSDFEESISSFPKTKSKSFIRRMSMQEGVSLHREIIENMGSRVSMEISRTNTGTLIPQDNRIRYFEKSINSLTKEDNVRSRRSTINQNSINETRACNPITEIINKSNSCHDIQNIPRTVSKIKNIRKTQQTPIKALAELSSPPRYQKPNFPDNANLNNQPVLNLSLRKKAKTEKMYSNQSLTNLTTFSKSYQNLPFTIDIDEISKSTYNNTSSMMSLFDDDDCNNSHLMEYKIDWKAIYCKVSSILINDIEKELISYFTNYNTDLRNFPVNVMYRYVTFNKVLDVVFNNILQSDKEVDFQEEILKIPTEILDIDYDMNSYNIVNLIKCNIKKMGGQIREYMERKSYLNLAKEKLKKTLDDYLHSSRDSNKMHSQIERIYKIFHELSKFLTSMVISMSMWKFSKDFSHLYENMNYQANILTTSESLLSEFNRSQRNLEKMIVTLFRRFKEDSSEEVLQLFDKLFSETLDTSICIPLFHDKLKRDNEMLGHLETNGIKDSFETCRKIQFV